MAKIEGLPYGACSRVAAELNASVSLVRAVANGQRQNVKIEEALLRVKREHQARLKRIERMKAKLDELRIGEIDTSTLRFHLAKYNIPSKKPTSNRWWKASAWNYAELEQTMWDAAHSITRRPAHSPYTPGTTTGNATAVEREATPLTS